MVTQHFQQLHLYFSNCIASAEMETEERSSIMAPALPNITEPQGEDTRYVHVCAAARLKRQTSWCFLPVTLRRRRRRLTSSPLCDGAARESPLQQTSTSCPALDWTVEVAAKVFPRPGNTIVVLFSLESSGLC